MKPVLPNEGAEWVSTCPTACPVFPTTDQGGPYSDIGGGEDGPPQDPVQSLGRTRTQVEPQAQLLCGDQRWQSPALFSRAGSRCGLALSRNQGGSASPDMCCAQAQLAFPSSVSVNQGQSTGLKTSSQAGVHPTHL